MTYKRTFTALSLCAALLLSGCNTGTPAPAVSESSTVTASAEITSAARSQTPASVSLGLTGVGNARELGGYRSADGRTVRNGVLLRTAALGNATEEDIGILREKYHLAVVADLRTDTEAEKVPDPGIDGVRNLRLPIMDAELLAERSVRMSELLAESEDPTDRMTQLLAAVDAGIVSDRMYVEFLMGKQGKENYRKLFEELLALPEGQSLLFHCSQGKDRTGVAAMLILSALGVDEETVMADYLLTNEYNAELIAGERRTLAERGIPEDKIDTYLMAMDRVSPETMTNALNRLKEDYGSVEGYLAQELGVGETELTVLKDKFLR
ncbi:MAG: tyrosine-protein phosphatase [Ruminiclostridium sp.]|nr:tyrosine-protein phosphatase [Ruminiclostridium sp.]